MGKSVKGIYFTLYQFQKIIFGSRTSNLLIRRVATALPTDSQLPPKLKYSAHELQKNCVPPNKKPQSKFIQQFDAVIRNTLESK